MLKVKASDLLVKFLVEVPEATYSIVLVAENIVAVIIAIVKTEVMYTKIK